MVFRIKNELSGHPFSPIICSCVCVCNTRLSFLFLNQIITQLHSISPKSCIITKKQILGTLTRNKCLSCVNIYDKRTFTIKYICKLVESFQLCKCVSLYYYGCLA